MKYTGGSAFAWSLPAIVTAFVACTLTVPLDDLQGGSAGGVGGAGGAGGVGGAECPDGEVSCDDSCVDVSISLEHCGACNSPCELDNATTTCSEGSCGLSSCDDGFTDCNEDGEDGCEIHTEQDPNNCGGCGEVCPEGAPNTMAVCNAGDCDTACAVGFLDCSNPADGCETDGTQDAANCGACGHDCLGGTCAEGECQPVVVATAQLDVGDIVVDGTHVYWTHHVASASGGAIRRADKSGGPATTFAPNLELPKGLISDATNVYVVLDDSGASDGQIVAVLKSDATKTPILTGLTAPRGLITDGTWFYLFEDGSIRRTSPGGSPYQTVATPTTVWTGLAFADGYLYWALSSGHVYAAEATPGAAIIDLGTALITTNVAAQPGAAIVVNLSGEVVRWKLDMTHAVISDAVGSHIWNDIVIDGDTAWVTSPGSFKLARVDLTTGETTVVVEDAGFAEKPALGADAIYWWDSQFAAIMKVAR